MSAFTWSPRPRPDGMTMDILGIRCRCGRKIYTTIKALGDALVDGQTVSVSDLECCRGCDERPHECYCAEVQVA